MKEVQMTLPVEAELHASFIAAAELEHRPASQVLRELMRSYVQQVRARIPANAINDRISAAERHRREDASNFSYASIALEGFSIGEEDQDLTRRFVDGEINLEDALKAAHESIRK